MIHTSPSVPVFLLVAVLSLFIVNVPLTPSTNEQPVAKPQSQAAEKADTVAKSKSARIVTAEAAENEKKPAKTAAAAKATKLSIYYYMNTPDGYRSLLRHGDQISIIAPKTFEVDSQGRLHGWVDWRVRAYAKKHDIGIMPLVSNQDFSQAVAHDVLSTPWKRTRMIKAMLARTKELDLAGFQVDFEMVSGRDRYRLNALMKEMHWRFKREDKLVSIAVMAKWSDGINPAFDYRTLAKHSDYVTLMAYDQHYRGSSPGPVAGLPWVANVVKYAKSQMPADKIVVGVPFYYRQWGGAHGTGRYNEAAWKAKKYGRPVWFSGEHKSPHLRFWAGGRSRNLWFEDNRSFKHKLDLIERSGVAGFAAWRIGQEDPRTWTVLKDKWNVEKGLFR